MSMEPDMDFLGPLKFDCFLLFYRYLADRSILNGISFDVPGGHSVAIVGTSGSGKSPNQYNFLSFSMLNLAGCMSYWF